MAKIQTREEWLRQGVILLTDVFKEMRHKIPKGILVSCGFPSTGAFAAKKQRIGECWYPQLHRTKKGAQQTYNLFVSPVLDEPIRVLDVLTHEQVHQ